MSDQQLMSCSLSSFSKTCSRHIIYWRDVMWCNVYSTYDVRREMCATCDYL